MSSKLFLFHAKSQRRLRFASYLSYFLCVNYNHNLIANPSKAATIIIKGSCVAALATFLPCYLFTVLPAPYFKKWGKHSAIKAIVDGITAAAIGAIAGAVFVLGKRQITDLISFGIAVATVLLLLRFKKLQEPFIIIVAALLGLAIKLWL